MNFAEARSAVRDGADPAVVAGDLVAEMTAEERLWCLDGDAPTWAGLQFLYKRDGYHRLPFAAAEVERLGVPGVHFSDGPRGVRGRQRHGVPRLDGPRGDVGLQRWRSASARRSAVSCAPPAPT